MMRLLKAAATAMLLAGAACSHGNASSKSTPQPIMQNGAAASDGAIVYQNNCSTCHQSSGVGLAGTFPPLAGNPVVTGDPVRVIHIVKDGLVAQITVKGVTYDGQMPAWGQTLSAEDIADVIIYIRSSWGNAAAAVTAAQVSKTR